MEKLGVSAHARSHTRLIQVAGFMAQGSVKPLP